jgi:hypothetical protein
MGIFGGSRGHVFKPSPYETRRRSRRLPRWFVLLVVGILLGGGGVLILQASYGPKRLTIAESQTLTDSLAAVSLERQQLQTKVTALERDLKNDRFQSEKNIESLKKSVEDLTTQLKPVRDEVALFMQAATTNLAFDPIGLSSVSLVQPRNSGVLAYHILLVQKDAKEPVFDGRIEVTFEGRYPNGRAGSIRALVAPIKLGHYQHLIGNVELPNGFQADRGTLRVFQGESTRALSFRTFNVARS